MQMFDTCKYSLVTWKQLKLVQKGALAHSLHHMTTMWNQPFYIQRSLFHHRFEAPKAAARYPTVLIGFFAAHLLHFRMSRKGDSTTCSKSWVILTPQRSESTHPPATTWTTWVRRFLYMTTSESHALGAITGSCWESAASSWSVPSDASESEDVSLDRDSSSASSDAFGLGAKSTWKKDFGSGTIAELNIPERVASGEKAFVLICWSTSSKSLSGLAKLSLAQHSAEVFPVEWCPIGWPGRLDPDPTWHSRREAWPWGCELW